MWMTIDYVISVAGFREVRMVRKVKKPQARRCRQRPWPRQRSDLVGDDLLPARQAGLYHVCTKYREDTGLQGENGQRSRPLEVALCHLAMLPKRKRSASLFEQAHLFRLGCGTNWIPVL